MNDTMGIIMTGFGEEGLGELTQIRSLGALPVFGRYRLIDFILSDLVNSEVTNVGVTTTSQYRSLMDHLGNGKAWDLNRKIHGLTILPPYLNGISSVGMGNIDILNGIMDFLQRSSQEYVILAASDTIYNTDFYAMKLQHQQTDADITVFTAPQTSYGSAVKGVAVHCAEDGRITDMQIGQNAFELGFAGTGTFFMKRELLCSLISKGISRGHHDFIRDILLHALTDLKVYAYTFTGALGFVDSVASYYKENLRLLDPNIFHAYFKSSNPILTKVKDQVPTVYGPNAKVTNCIVADGCIINGTVENSIIFRGVEISESAKVSNSVIMQKSKISDNAELDCVILDKNVTIRNGKRLTGQESYPVVIHKNAVV